MEFVIVGEVRGVWTNSFKSRGEAEECARLHIMQGRAITLRIAKIVAKIDMTTSTTFYAECLPPAR